MDPAAERSVDADKSAAPKPEEEKIPTDEEREAKHDHPPDGKKLPTGTCEATNPDLKGKRAAQLLWNNWCDEVCVDSKWGGLGAGACVDATGTGAVGCVCKQGVGLIDIYKDQKKPEVPAVQPEEQSAAAPSTGSQGSATVATAPTLAPSEQPAPPKVKDSATCVSVIEGTTDYWCGETCKTGSCPDICKCDEEAKQVLKDREQALKDAADKVAEAAEAAKRAASGAIPDPAISPTAVTSPAPASAAPGPQGPAAAVGAATPAAAAEAAAPAAAEAA